MCQDDRGHGHCRGRVSQRQVRKEEIHCGLQKASQDERSQISVSVNITMRVSSL